MTSLISCRTSALVVTCEVSVVVIGDVNCDGSQGKVRVSRRELLLVEGRNICLQLVCWWKIQVDLESFVCSPPAAEPHLKPNTAAECGSASGSGTKDFLLFLEFQPASRCRERFPSESTETHRVCLCV